MKTNIGAIGFFEIFAIDGTNIKPVLDFLTQDIFETAHESNPSYGIEIVNLNCDHENARKRCC
jgi:hypothetical protein